MKGTAGAKSGLALFTMYSSCATILWNLAFFSGFNFGASFLTSYNFAVAGVDIALLLKGPRNYFMTFPHSASWKC